MHSWLNRKNLPAGQACPIPVVIPGGRVVATLLQYLPGESKDRGALVTIVHGVAKRYLPATELLLPAAA